MQSLHRKTRPTPSVSVCLPLDLKRINLMSYTPARRPSSCPQPRPHASEGVGEQLLLDVSD